MPEKASTTTDQAFSSDMSRPIFATFEPHSAGPVKRLIFSMDASFAAFMISFMTIFSGLSACHQGSQDPVRP